MASSPPPSTETAIESPAFELRSIARLPEPFTSFIGRENELLQLQNLLDRPSTRLVTLTGPGGVGKTRLAIAFARERSVSTSVPVGFIPLAPLRDSSLVAATIGAAFGLSDSGDQLLAERLQTILQDKPFLLVLDNFEHLVDVAPLTSLLLNTCPALTILATSRRSLNVSGEIEYLVPPLGTPGQNDSREIIERSPSFQLFVERSPAGAGGMTDAARRQDIEAIGAICSRLDGLPLAIELAAARTRLLPPSELLARLYQRLPLLIDGPIDAPVRLQSMRDAIGWSFDLLSDDEQRLLRTLSVFSGGFTLDAVEAVNREGLATPALELLSHLIDHNLVRRMDTQVGPSRFTMLETIREFALDSLQAQAEETDIRNRHLRWFVVSLGSPGLESWCQIPIGYALQGDHDNLRAALRFALQHQDAGCASQIAWGLLPFWWRHGFNIEGGESLQRIVDLASTLDPEILALIYCRIAEFVHTYGDDTKARYAASRALALSRDSGHYVVLHNALYGMGLCTRLSDPSASVDWMRQAAELSRTTGDDRRLAMDLDGSAWANLMLGNRQDVLADTAEALPICAQYPGEYEMRHNHAIALSARAWAYGLLGQIDQADDCATQALALSRQFDIHNGFRVSRLVLGEVALKRGDHYFAAEHLKEWLRFFHALGTKSYGTFGFAAIAMLSQATGDWHRAAQLSGFADAFWTRSHYPESAWTVAAWSFDLASSRRSLGEVEFAAQVEAGRRLTDAEAFAEASIVTASLQLREGRNTVLTRRESEILAHLSQGKTNQEIAGELFVGKSTVDTHVAHILAKFGVESRRAAVNAARERGLL